MSTLQKKTIFLISVIAILMFFWGLKWSKQKLTYIEFKSFNSSNDTYITLEEKNDTLMQEFEMPYDYLRYVSIQIGTFERVNNSKWEILIKDKMGKVIAEKVFNASLINDNSYYNIDFKKNIKVDKNEKYILEIKAVDVDNISCLAFYSSSDALQIEDSILTFNGQKMNGELCFKIYGGDVDYWWTYFIILLFLIVCFLVVRLGWLFYNEKNISDDILLQGVIISCITFLLLFTFATADGFCDESDNMFGGMIIANGGVLYRDYITQHTPVAYYLCSLFALTGAASVEQFRLLYYIFESLIWGGIYVRYVNHFGWRKMAILPILEVICISSVVSPYGSQILSDGIQGILFVILLLEYLIYLKDKKLDWKRCCIISLCIWGSFGSAFVSAYALIWVVGVVTIIEIIDWGQRALSVKKVIKRYYKLIISIIVPFVIAVFYFKINHSLRRAFDQFYTFNRKVYPQYIGGLGDKITQPFINAIQNFFGMIANNFNSLITGDATNVTVLQLCIMVGAIGLILTSMEKRKIWESVILFLVMIFSATRGYDFHGLAAWYVAILIIALNINIIYEKIPTISKSLLGLITIVLLSTYIIAVGNNLLYQEKSISDMEGEVIALTENCENKKIYLDAWTSGSLYYFYKGRYPINCAVFMLPWYMDWYEEDNIKDLNENNPKVVVYNENEEVWGYTNYTVKFASELKKNYSRMSDDDTSWKYSVWIREE